MKFICKKIYFICIFYPLFLIPEVIQFPENFNSLPKGEQRKKEFVAILLPMIESENKRIAQERQYVLEFFQESFLQHIQQKLQNNQYKQIVAIAQRYRINRLLNYNEYLKRIDIIPPSLALAQAALESGWGISVYSKKYNNLFGEYTMHSYVPARKIRGNKRRIRVFNSLRQSIRAYMWNLNTHYAYSHFREERFNAHSKGGGYSGLEALSYLLAYSEIREQYAQKVAILMSENSFLELDISFFRENHPYFARTKQEKLKIMIPYIFLK